MRPESSNWSSYERYVVAELTRLATAVERVASDTAQMKAEIAVLKSESSKKATLLGALSGAATAVIMLAVDYLKGK